MSRIIITDVNGKRKEVKFLHNVKCDLCHKWVDDYAYQLTTKHQPNIESNYCSGNHCQEVKEVKEVKEEKKVYSIKYFNLWSEDKCYITKLQLHIGQVLRRRIGSGTQRIKIRKITPRGVIYFDKQYYGYTEGDNWKEHKTSLDIQCLANPLGTVHFKVNYSDRRIKNLKKRCTVTKDIERNWRII